MTTWCDECDHVHPTSRKLPPWRWLCMKHPRLNEGFGFVTGTSWDNAEPYLKCKDCNAGACPNFKLAESGQMKLEAI